MSNLCQPEEGRLGQIQTRGGDRPEQVFPSNILPNNNNNCLKSNIQKVQWTIINDIIIVIQYNSFYIMRYDNNPIF